jgi:hypothetical protein
MSWADRASANLLPLSREKSDLARALREWRYTGQYNDLEAPAADCELCDHPDSRYQFEIQNLHTGETLLIGSECIHRFGIAATDEEGRTLDAAATRKKVEKDRRRLIEDARKRRVVSALVALAHADKEFDILSFVDYLQLRGAFTPKQLSILFWRLDKHRIRYDARDFKLTIRRDREKAQLVELADWQLRRFTPRLSESQRSYLAKIGRGVI